MIARQPDDGMVYFGRGLAYYDKKEYERAIADFTQAIELKPDFATAYSIRGLAYFDNGDPVVVKKT